MVVLLNAVFRIGTSKKHSLLLQPATEDVEKIYPFMEECGGQWGARREVEERAQSALVEAYELLSGEELAEGPIQVEASFDEFSLDLTLRYNGRLPQGENTGILAAAVGIADRSAASLATMLLNRMADRVRMKTANGRCELELHFEH
jgi:NCS2 family nucleobase:cation symporter-2